jgi:hypothetical protein
MFLRDRIRKIYSIHGHMNFYNRLLNGKQEEIDFLACDKELHFICFTELFKELQSSRAGHPWRSDEIEYLFELYKEGKSIRCISKELCRSENAVVRKLESQNQLLDEFDTDLEFGFDDEGQSTTYLYRGGDGRDY